jgi:hypothetical protein
MRKQYSITIHYKKIPAASWQLKYSLIGKDDYPYFARSLEILVQEFSKYPRSFIKRTRLSSIAFAKNIFLKGQARGAIPDYLKEMLLFDIEKNRKAKVHERYIRHCIHHEFYHMIEQEINGSAYWKDPAWAKLNIRNFRYGKGGARARSSNMYLFTHPQKGFINLYAMSGLEEDKAEVYSILFMPSEFRRVSGWAETDPILKAKIAYMIKFLNRLDRTFSKQYWTNLHKKKKPKPNPVAALNSLQKKLGIEVRYDKVPYLEENTIHCKNLTQEEAKAYTPLLVKELSRYPAEFIEDLGIHRVVLCKDLTWKSPRQTGYALDYDGAIVLNTQHGAGTQKRDAIHYAVFNYFDWIDDFAVESDKEWTKLNPSGFRYKSSSGLKKGFISPYAARSLRTDKAELFRCLITSYKGTMKRAQADPILQAKINLLKKYLHTFSKGMDNTFWNSLTKNPK